MSEKIPTGAKDVKGYKVKDGIVYDTSEHTVTIVIKTPENETEMIATAVTEIPPAPAGKNFILMNLSSGSLPFEADRIEDCDGNAAAVLPPGGIAFRGSN